MDAATRPGGLTLHPLHAILLAFPIALFTGAVATDIAYLNTAEIQWSTFSAWLISGALFFGVAVLVWALVDVVLALRMGGVERSLTYFIILGGMWVAGLINFFQHSRDGWSSVGAIGLILSIISAFLALSAGWIAHSGRGPRELAR